MSDTHTPGPWRWELNEKAKQIHLCGGVPTFDLTVMDFVRWGMGCAAPRLRELSKDRMNIMHRIERWGCIAPGRAHHSDWFKAIRHADADLIAAAPDLLAACKAAAVDFEFTALALRSHNTAGADHFDEMAKVMHAAIAKAEPTP